MVELRKKPGQPTLYMEKYNHIAEVACREGGFTDAKLAKLFDVTKMTITNWKREHPEFFSSIKRGKDDYDSLNVENDLLKRARGFTYKEVTQEPGVVDGGLRTTKVVKKLVIPDTTAQIFWLKNRNPARWRDTKTLDGNMNVTLHEADLEELE